MRGGIDRKISQGLNAPFVEGRTVLLDQAIEQLREYFSGKRTTFDLPLKLVGTDFQIEIWKHLQNIPFGETVSYLELARLYGDEKAVRAVASANGANAISIIVPCHRVVGSDGSLTGYAGGLPVKKKLLTLEGALQSEQTTLNFSYD